MVTPPPRPLGSWVALGYVGAAVNGCDVLFDAETAARVRTEVSSRMGGVCPCDDGRRCPLLPEGFGAALLPMPVLLKLETLPDALHRIQ